MKFDIKFILLLLINTPLKERPIKLPIDFMCGDGLFSSVVVA